MPALNRPRTQIAKLLGVSRQTLYDLLEENQPVTPIMALRLGKLCGNGPDLGSICRGDTICNAPPSSSFPIAIKAEWNPNGALCAP